MTVIAEQVPVRLSSFRHQEARRKVEAARRRQDALARLAQRRMPLPGQPLPATMYRGHMSLVTSMPGGAAASPCTCGPSVPVEQRPALTDREVEVLRTWLKLDSKPAAAEALFISLGTVNTHLARIRTKYSDRGRPASTKAALVARAVQDGHVSLDEL